MAKLPECSKWKVWHGKEIEGSEQIGVTTIFLRHIDRNKLDQPLLTKISKVDYGRIWICQNLVYEMTHGALSDGKYPLLGKILKPGITVVAEITPYLLWRLDNNGLFGSCLQKIPGLQFFLKIIPKEDGISPQLRHISYGVPYSDVTFSIRAKEVTEVKPSQYGKDVCLA